MIGKHRPNKKREFYPSVSGFRLETVLAYSNVSVFNLETEFSRQSYDEQKIWKFMLICEHCPV
jgi:hypothetical protein